MAVLGIELTAKDSASAALQRMQKELDQLNATFGKTGSQAHSAGSGLADAGKKARQAGEGAEHARGKFGGLFDSLKAGVGIGAGMMGLQMGVDALKGALGGTIGVAAKFESGMREVNSLINLSEGEFKSLSKGVNALSMELGVEAVGATKALYQAISAGVPADNALEFLATASKAAIGGVTDTETAVDGLTTVLNAFKMESSEVERVADVMFTTVKQGKTTFGELSGAMFNVAPIAQAAGVSFDEVSASIATLTKQGTPTSVATTQIRAAIQGLLKPSAEITAIFNAMGYESAAAAIKVIGLQPSLDAVRVATNGDIGAMQGLLGSVEAVAATLGTTGENATMFAGDLDAMRNAAGASQTAFEEMNKSFGRQMETLKSALQGIMITIGNELLPLLTPVVAWITENLPRAFQSVGEAVERIKPVIDGLFSGLSTGDLSDFVAQVQTLTGFDLSGIIAAFQAVGETIGRIGQALAGLDFSGLTDGLSAAAERLKPALDAVGTSIEQNVLPALGRFSAALGQTSSDMDDSGSAAVRLNKAMESFGTALEGVAIAANAILGPAIWLLTTALGGLIDMLAGPVTMGLQLVESGLKILEGAIQVLGGVIRGMIDIVEAALAGDWAEAWTAAQRMVEQVDSGVRGIVEGLAQAVGAIFNALFGNVVSMARGFSESVIGIFRTLSNVLVGNSIVPEMTAAIEGHFDSMAGGVTGTTETLRDDLSTLFGAIEKDGTTHLRTLESEGTGAAAALAAGATGSLEGLESGGISAMESLQIQGTQAITTFSVDAQSVMSALAHVATTVLGETMTAVAGTVSAAAASIVAAFEAAQGRWESIMDAMARAAEAAAGAIRSALDSIPREITTVHTIITNSVENVTRIVVGGGGGGGGGGDDGDDGGDGGGGDDGDGGEEESSSVPRFARGAYVSSPTYAMIGEAGPEVVLPVEMLGDIIETAYHGLLRSLRGSIALDPPLDEVPIGQLYEPPDEVPIGLYEPPDEVPIGLYEPPDEVPIGLYEPPVPGSGSGGIRLNIPGTGTGAGGIRLNTPSQGGQIIPLQDQPWRNPDQAGGWLGSNWQDLIPLSSGTKGALPRFGEGAYVASPTYAMIGESGPEVVLPIEMFDDIIDDIWQGLRRSVPGLGSGQLQHGTGGLQHGRGSNIIDLIDPHRQTPRGIGSGSNIIDLIDPHRQTPRGIGSGGNLIDLVNPHLQTPRGVGSGNNVIDLIGGRLQTPRGIGSGNNIIDLIDPHRQTPRGVGSGNGTIEPPRDSGSGRGSVRVNLPGTGGWLGDYERWLRNIGVGWERSEQGGQIIPLQDQPWRNPDQAGGWLGSNWQDLMPADSGLKPVFGPRVGERQGMTVYNIQVQGNLWQREELMDEIETQVVLRGKRTTGGAFGGWA